MTEALPFIVVGEQSSGRCRRQKFRINSFVRSREVSKSLKLKFLAAFFGGLQTSELVTKPYRGSLVAPWAKVLLP